MNSLIIAQNIIKRVFKSPREILSLIVLPVLFIAGISFAMGYSSSPKTPVGVVVLDDGELSKKLVAYMDKQIDYKIVKLSEKNYIKPIQDKTVKMAVIIPDNFSADIEADKKVEIGFYSISKDLSSEALKQALNRYTSILYQVSEAVKLTGKSQQGVFDSLLKNVESEQISFQYQKAGKDSALSDNGSRIPSIGFAVMFMMVLIFTTIGTILDDKRNLTLARMFVSPVRELEIILGNILGSLTIGVIQLIPLVTAFKFIFNLSSLTEIAGLALALFSFLVSTVGLGIGISGIIKKDFNPTLILAVVIAPSSILGGCFIPASMMPDVMNKIGYIVPQKWVMDAIRQVFNGSDIQAILLDLAVVLMFGFAFATFGLRTIRPLND